MNNREKKMATIRTVIIAIIIFMSFIVATEYIKNQSKPYPNYAVEFNDSTLWENMIISENNTQWNYRRKITMINPTDTPQNGTFGYKLPFHYPWFGDRKVFKVDYGIVKLVQEFENPIPDGAPLLRELPLVVFGYDESTLMVLFNYEINASSKNTYYLYYKHSNFVNTSFYDNVSVGYASIGGYMQNWKQSGWNSETGFAVGWNNFVKSNISMKEGDYYYFDHFVVTEHNRWPRYNQFSYGGGSGMRSNEPFEARNKYIRIAGDRYNTNNNYLGFFNGSLTPQNAQPEKPFIGIHTVPESDPIDNPDYSYAPKGDVNDFVFHYANMTTSGVWKNPYVVPKDTSDIFDWNYRRVNFLYEFFIDGEGNLKFKLSEDGFTHKEVTSVNLGKIPWETVYFQISSTTYSFVVQSAIITDDDVFDSEQRNGVSIDVGYETNLEYMQNLRMENGYMFFMALISMAFVIIHLLLRVSFVDKPIRVYLMLSIAIIIYLIARFHPIRLVFGIEEGYYYIGSSEMGVELLQNAGSDAPALFYFMYFAMPLGILLIMLNYRKKMASKADLSNRTRKALLIYPKIGLGIVALSALLFIFPSTLISVSFFMLCIAIFIIIYQTYKDGTENGKDSKDPNTKWISRYYARFSFVYFVLKVILESYKNWNVSDPFAQVTESGTDMSSVLGPAMPLLLNYGIPASILSIIAFIFSNMITYIILGFTFLKESFSSDDSIYGKLNAGIWAVYLSVAGDNIHLPFLSTILALTSIVAYLISNRYDSIGSMYLGFVLNDYFPEIKKRENRKQEVPKSSETPKETSESIKNQAQHEEENKNTLNPG